MIVSDSGDVWRDDEIELAFDAAHDLISGEPDGPSIHGQRRRAPDRWRRANSRRIFAVFVRPVAGGWDVEARLPIHALQSGPLFVGRRRSGFTLGLHDDDDGAGQYTRVEAGRVRRPMRSIRELWWR